MPGRNVLRRPVTTPDTTSLMTPSEIISVCTPRSCRSPRAAEDGVRDLADAHLQRGAVGDERGHVAADLGARVVDGPRRELRQRGVDWHQPRDALDVDERIAERPRHSRVDLARARGPPCRRPCCTMSTDTPRLQKPVRSGGRHLDERDIDPDATRGDEARDLGQEDRHEVRAAVVHRGAHVGRPMNSERWRNEPAWRGSA